MLIRVALAACLLLIGGGCAATQPKQADIPYKTYANVPMTKIGGWTGTEIHVPKRALVAVMAEGECWSFKGSMKRSLDPTACLQFKIGEKGLRRDLSRFYDSEHVRVIKSTTGGPLFYSIAPFLKEKRNWEAKFSATVLVWEKGHSDKIESDIADLISAHPGQKQYLALLFSLAGSFTQTGEYSRAEKILKPIRETSGGQGREAIVALTLSAENERWLRRYDRPKVYAEEALEISRREGRRRMQVEALLILSEVQWHLGQYGDAIQLAEKALKLSGEVRPGSIYFIGRSHQVLVEVECVSVLPQFL